MCFRGGEVCFWGTASAGYTTEIGWIGEWLLPASYLLEMDSEAA